MIDTLQSLTDRANLLKREGRLSEAIEVFIQAAKAYPRSAVTEHNLAGALGDAGRAAEAEAHARQAMAMGLDAPQTWLVLARSLQAQGQDDAALQAYETALLKAPNMLDAHLEWAQLVWMRTGDAAAAARRIDQAVRAMPDQPGLRSIRGRILEFTVGAAPAYACFADAIERWPDDVGLLLPAVAVAAMAGEVEAAVTLARRAQALAPGLHAATEALACALLASGEIEEGAQVAQLLRTGGPVNQHAIAIEATVARLMGDARHAQLYDYETFVRPYMIDTPQGWPSLEAYLADLAEGLKSVHPYLTHPFGQSVRQGSQLPNILGYDNPAIRAFPDAIKRPIQDYIDTMGRGSDPLRSRNTGRWQLDGIWSVWLRPGGFHTDHVHPDGWISSACYIQLPAAVSGENREGWIKFGEPGIPTRPALAAEHAVRPVPGMLVLFPSYMWHGTIAFSGTEPRLTMAMDIVPA